MQSPFWKESVEVVFHFLKPGRPEGAALPQHPAGVRAVTFRVQSSGNTTGFALRKRSVFLGAFVIAEVSISALIFQVSAAEVTAGDQHEFIIHHFLHFHRPMLRKSSAAIRSSRQSSQISSSSWITVTPH